MTAKRYRILYELIFTLIAAPIILQITLKRLFDINSSMHWTYLLSAILIILLFRMCFLAIDQLRGWNE